MQRRLALIVYFVYIHFFQLYEIVKRGWLITLCRDVEHVGSVHALGHEISMHIFHQDPNQLVVSMVSSEVQCRKFFVG